MNKILLSMVIIASLLISSCSSVRESAGVNRKNIDEYQVIENPPLIIPPDFNLLPPEQMQSKKIEKLDSETAKQILFGLDDTEDITSNENNLLQDIIEQTNNITIDSNIRKDIDNNFAGEKLIDKKLDFKNDEEISDAIKKSELERENLEGKKKKKRFFFFNTKEENKDEKEDEPKKKKRFFLF